MRAFFLYAGMLAAALAAAAAVFGALLAPFAAALDAETHAKAVKYASLLAAAALLALGARARGITARQLGLDEDLRAFVRGAAGMFVVAVLLLLPLWAFLLILGGRELAPLHAITPNRFLAYALTGFAVSLLEESYFRGLLLSQARPRFAAPLLAGAALYAVVHLFDPQPVPMERWNAGLLLLAGSWPMQAEAWLAEAAQLALLFGIGVLLGLLRLHTNRLALCIGAHAAMVFSIKTFQHTTTAGENAPVWLGSDPYGGFAAAIWIAVLGILALFALFAVQSTRSKNA